MKKPGYFLLLLPLLFSFGKSKNPQHSKYLTKHYVKVPAGSVYTNVTAEFIETKNLNSVKDSLSEFFISSTEITNNNWKEFLMYLKQEGRIEEYNENLLDTTVWQQKITNVEPFIKYYYQHNAYADYPVVGMTLKQAKAYAEWLTQIWAMNDKVKKSGVEITFSVPTKKQWIRAARGEWQTHYPWNGQNMRDPRGSFLANFKTIDERYITKTTINGGDKDTYGVRFYDDSTKKEMTIIAPSKSYFPNQFGLYNMSGNVAELVSDDTVAMGGSWYDTGYDVRVESEQPATQPRSTIGFRVVAVIVK